MLHSFPLSTSNTPLPKKFTYPFNYTPHPLCEMAAAEVQAYLSEQLEWAEELSLGKMFGVLVVETAEKELGFLAAFSGNLAGKNFHPYFVPPVFDMLKKDDFFLLEVKEISAINERLELIQKDKTFIKASTELAELKKQAEKEIEALKLTNKQNKQERDAQRKAGTSDAESLAKASVYDKAYLRQIQNTWQEKINEKETALTAVLQEIAALKLERKTRSAALQQEIFRRFQFLNNKGESESLHSIFEQTAFKTPPAGAGECAGPKLLQYAYLQNLTPIAMAEFWWGASPKTEIRKHLHYYPACNGKCKPILGHMLQGVEVDENPLEGEANSITHLDIVFEDDAILLINKPAGVLSVRGTTSADSIQAYLERKYAEGVCPLIVHRLDMDTSGLLLIAKTKEAHKSLQEQFKHRSINKTYIALLDGIISEDSGSIDLPLYTDPLNRPHQVVDYVHGKPALTHWKVLERRGKHTLVEFKPVTGRTHQLRVHAAHVNGLNAPIVGDNLYGNKADRLYLHAQKISFMHPYSKKNISFEANIEF